MLTARFLFAVSLLFGASVWAAPVTFPGSRHAVNAPSKRVAVLWVEATSQTPHELLLVGGRGLQPILSFARHVSVEWSPAGDAFVVTDAFASDGSRIFVYSVTNEGRLSPVPVEFPLDLSDELHANHHAFLQATGWTMGTLRVLASGYGDGGSGRGFERELRCSRSKGVFLCR
jgi:hypothetical protein